MAQDALPQLCGGRRLSIPLARPGTAFTFNLTHRHWHPLDSEPPPSVGPAVGEEGASRLCTVTAPGTQEALVAIACH